MYQFILLIHVFAAVFIVGLVLLQQGKGATMGAAFGSGASQTVFGSRGSGSFLFRATMGLITIFFITSITLNYLMAHSFKQEREINLPLRLPVKNNISEAPGKVSKENNKTEIIGDKPSQKTLPEELPTEIS